MFVERAKFAESTMMIERAIIRENTKTLERMMQIKWCATSWP
jgi:hypothetical protein